MAGEARVGTIVIGMRAGVGGLSKDLGQARGELAGFEGSFQGSLGKLAAMGGGAYALEKLAGAASDAVAVAADLETRFVGLAKATDLGDGAFGTLKDQLRTLSVELRGVPVEDLIGIATTGAKMGVAADELVPFTEGVAKLSTAMDDVPAEQIAEQIGKINAVFEMGTRGTMQLGSAIDRLADSGISSASGIMEVAQAVSGTARISKIGAADTLALSAALLDTGTDAGLAATTLQRLMLGMSSVKSQAGFADALGLSVDQLKQRLGTDATGVLYDFLAALKAMDAETQQTAIGSILGRDAPQAIGEIQKLALQVDSARKYAGLAREEFGSLNQISQSYGKTAETLAARQDQFNNRIKLLQEEAGLAFAPLKEGALEFAIDVIPTVTGVIDGISTGFQTAQATVTWFVWGSVKGFAAMAHGLESLLNLIPGVNVDLTDTLDTMEASLRTDFEDQWRGGALAIGQAADAAKKLDAAAGGTTKIVTAADAARASLLGAAEATQKLNDSVADLTADLKTQIATFGMSSTEADLYKLAQQGATEAQLADARALGGQLEALTKADEAKKQMQDDAKSLIDATRTPFEKFQAQVADVRKLLDAGLIDQTTFARATTQAQGELGTNPTQGAAALEAGSQEARSAVLAFQRRGSSGRDPVEEVKQNTGQQVQQQMRTNELLGTMISRIGSGAGQAVSDVFSAA